MSYQLNGQRYALKDFILGRQQNDLKMFQRELRVFQLLDHPHIIKLVGYFVEGEHAYVMMPFCEGGTLADWLKSEFWSFFFSHSHYHYLSVLFGQIYLRVSF